MAVLRLLDFVVIYSADTVTFAESEGSPPLWVIDTKVFAGQPLLTVKTRKTLHDTQTTIVLSGARYPGTNLPADLSIQMDQFPGDENNSASQDVDLKLALGSVEFGWEFAPIDTDPQTQVDLFLEFLKGREAATALISVSGVVAALAGGGSVSFGPAVSATLSVLPGIVTIEGDNVCIVNVAGVTIEGTSISVAALTPVQTDLVIEATSPFSVPLPASTPLGSLIAQPGFSQVTVHTSETQQNATFLSQSGTILYVLGLLDGVTDLESQASLINFTAGEVNIDLSFTPPRITFIAAGSFSSTTLLSAGVGLLTKPDGNAIGLSMVFDGTAWSSVQTSMPLLGVIVPMENAIVEPINVSGVLSLLPTGTPPDPSANASWLVIGTTNPGDLRLRVTPVAFNVLRPLDLLALQFRLDGLALQAVDGRTPSFAIAQPGQSGTLSVVLPPQHVAEEAYYADAPGFPQPGDPPANTPGLPPIAIRAAGTTTLAFTVSGDLAAQPLTLDNLLSWAAYALAPSLTGSSSNPQTTSIELPYRLMLSPDESAGFANDNFSLADTDRVALWQARLGTRRRATDGSKPFFVDERETPPLSIVGSPDFTQPRPDDNNMLPFSARVSLTQSDRHDIAELGQKRSDRLAVNRLMLSALGGWLDSRIAWTQGGLDRTTGNDVVEWRHIAAQGRDQYVRVVHLGFLFPWGHRASWVKVTERRFTGGLDATSSNPAYLIERDFVIVTQPVVSYQQGDGSLPRDLPFTKIELLTLTTPTLDAPVSLPSVTGLEAFSLNLTNAPFPFHMRGTDLTGRTVNFDAAAIFVREDGVTRSEVMSAVRAAYDAPPGRLDTVSYVNGQKIAFAPPSSVNAEDTTLEVESLRFMTGPSPAAANPQSFYPRVERASVHLPAARALAATGGDGTVAIGYMDKYLSAGLVSGDPNNPAEIFAVPYADLFATAPSNLSIGFSGDKSAGVAAPNMDISGLSRKFGTVSGTAFTSNSTPQFDVGSYFPDSATLFGGIGLNQLKDLFENTGEEGVPQLKVDTSTPPVVRTFLKWNPKVNSNSKSIGDLQFHFDEGNPGETAGSFSLESTTVTALPPEEPSSHTTGVLTNFKLDFADLVTIHFKEFTFKADNGRKPDVTLTLAPDAITLGGDLNFLQILLEKLRDIFGAGPSVDIENGVITAGYSVAVPTVSIGVFSLENIRVSVSVIIPLSGADPIAFRFSFAEKEHPFTLTVDLLGGGGFFGIVVDSTGIQSIELAVEAGANVAFDLAGLASGNAHVMIGVYFHYAVGSTAIGGFLRAGAELTVLQLVSLHVEFYAGLTYVSSGGQSFIFASVSVMVDVAVGMLHTGVTLSLERKFAVPGSNTGSSVRSRILADAPTGRVQVADVMTQDDWNQYSQAFA